MLERIFHLRAAGSTPGREALGGVTTFLTLAYILAVNPVFLRVLRGEYPSPFSRTIVHVSYFQLRGLRL